MPRTGRADVVVRVDGSVSLKHFTLAKPDKIVLDLTGATLACPQGDAYDGVARGGITRIRYSQFTKTIVRVVLTLDAPHSYTVSNDNGELHISVDGADREFSPWQVGAEHADRREAPLAKRCEPAERRPGARAVGAEGDRGPAPVRERSRRATRRRQPRRRARLHDRATRAGRAASPAVAGAAHHHELGKRVDQPTFSAIFAAFTGRTILPSKNVTGK